MADNITTVTPGTTPSTGGLNYAEYQKKIKEAAAKTQNVASSGGAIKQATLAAQKLQKEGQERRFAPQAFQQANTLSKSLIENFKTQETAQRVQAKKAASALEMVGSSTLQGMKNIEAIQRSTKAAVAKAADSWGAAAEKADDYVKASRGRVTEVLSKLDEIHQQIGKDRDFAKAHAMQASVQAVIGSMKDEERNIVENYGTDSKEFAQFQASKQNALATVQSNIQANFAQLREQSDQTYLNTVSDSYTKSNMYLGFQEQQHVEMLKYQAEQENSFALQAAQLDVSIEQMKMTGMENLANWLVETPVFTMDATPLIAAIADLGATARAQDVAIYQTHKAGKSQGTDWGAIAGTVGGAIVGGPVGAAIGGRIGSAASGAGKKQGSEPVNYNNLSSYQQGLFKNTATSGRR